MRIKFAVRVFGVFVLYFSVMNTFVVRIDSQGQLIYFSDAN